MSLQLGHQIGRDPLRLVVSRSAVNHAMANGGHGAVTVQTQHPIDQLLSGRNPIELANRVALLVTGGVNDGQNSFRMADPIHFAGEQPPGRIACREERALDGR